MENCLTCKHAETYGPEIGCEVNSLKVSPNGCCKEYERIPACSTVSKVKINFYDFAIALQELSNHYDISKIDYLIEELQDSETNNIIVETDGCSCKAYIEECEADECI